MTLPLLQQQLRRLNLANMARHLEEALRQAREEGVGYDEFLLSLTALELRIR